VISERSKGDMSDDEDDMIAGQSDNSEDGELIDDDFERDIVPIVKSKLNSVDESSFQVSDKVLLLRPQTLDLQDISELLKSSSPAKDHDEFVINMNKDHSFRELFAQHDRYSQQPELEDVIA
jgi:hypothetical protein